MWCVGWDGGGSGHRCTGQVGIAGGKDIYQLNGERPVLLQLGGRPSPIARHHSLGVM